MTMPFFEETMPVSDCWAPARERGKREGDEPVWSMTWRPRAWEVPQSYARGATESIQTGQTCRAACNDDGHLG